MKLLVIGGSYFFGRVFVMESAEHEITVVNRGTYSMEEYGARQITGDRHQAALWESITEDYDVLIDFCAYEKGDISFTLEHLRGKIRQYILISTVDVYERGKDADADSDAREGAGLTDVAAITPVRENHVYRTEAAGLEQRIFPGDAGNYIAGKVALEAEVRRECDKRGIAWTILRPAILYGPYNYAPRESYFVQLMVQNHVLPVITDATGAFQFLYVKDAAHAVKKCLLHNEAYRQAYNLCGDETIDYDSFAKELEKNADIDIRILPMTQKQAQEQGVMLPFPVQEEESLLCSNEKSKQQLGMVYTTFYAGMKKTYQAFATVFGS